MKYARNMFNCVLSKKKESNWVLQQGFMLRISNYSIFRRLDPVLRYAYHATIQWLPTLPVGNHH